MAVRSSGPNHLSDSTDRQEFLRESRLLASLRHTNVAKLIGVAMSEEPYCTILEHSLQGDLYHYLRQISKVVNLTHSTVSTVSSSTSSSGCSSGSLPNNGSSNSSINYSRLVDMAAQIASGMKYMETRNIVHKDLAARYIITLLSPEISPKAEIIFN